MEQFLSRGSYKGEQKKKPNPSIDDAREKEGAFPETTGCLMIFGGTIAYDSKRCQKLVRREVYTAEPATPTFLRWLRSPITFNRSNHPESILHPNRYPLVVDPVIGMKRLTKLLMDGGSSLYIMYAETLDAMGIDRTCIRLTGGPLQGIVLGKQAKPLRQIDLPITFRYLSNFRTKTLTFEVVGFHGTYHAILGRPCYAKFMAILNYTYLKLKMQTHTGSSPSAPPSSALTNARWSVASSPWRPSPPM
jgi:hypothetical protein